MKAWKRNAVVAVIVLFVCVAVYLNWSYNQEPAQTADTGKVLGEAVVEEAGKSFLDGLGGESLVIALEAGCLGDFQGHGGVVASQPQHGHDLEQLGKAQAGKQGGGEGGV